MRSRTETFRKYFFKHTVCSIYCVNVGRSQYESVTYISSIIRKRFKIGRKVLRYYEFGHSKKACPRGSRKKVPLLMASPLRLIPPPLSSSLMAIGTLF